MSHYAENKQFELILKDVIVSRTDVSKRLGRFQKPILLFSVLIYE